MRKTTRQIDRSFGRALVAAPVMCLAIIQGALPAQAYRPFDGTDAAVAALGEVEIELGPIGRLHEGFANYIVAPSTVFNYGFAPTWELVIQGQVLNPQNVPEHSRLTDIAVNLKHVLKDGVLQDKTGVSIATEFGVLIPGTDKSDGKSAGASLAAIISDRFPWGTAHLNIMGERTKDEKNDFFVSLILEGPEKWPVRPVAEFYFEDKFNVATTKSGLIGLIWQVRDDLSFDIADRQAWTNGVSVNEIRAGLTFAFKPFEGSKSKHE